MTHEVTFGTCGHDLEHGRLLFGWPLDDPEALDDNTG